MIALLASLAFAQQTRLFETDQAAADWARLTRSAMRTRLPIVGPDGIEVLEPLLQDADIAVFAVGTDVDPEEAALAARSRAGSPCALAFAPLEQGWTGWVSGHCGLLFLGAWRFEPNGRVVDDRGRVIPVPRFAADSGDLQVLSTYKRFDRIRGRAIWNIILGTGLLYVGQIGLAAARNDGDSTRGWWITTGVGGALTTAGVGQFVWVQADKRSHPRDLRAHYTDEEIKERIQRHNARLRLVSIGPTGLFGRF